MTATAGQLAKAGYYSFSAGSGTVGLCLVLILAVMAMGLMLFLISRLRRCPPGRALIVYGRFPDGRLRKVVRGAAFIWPMIQAYDYLDLTAVEIRDLRIEGESRDRAAVGASISAVVAVSPDPGMVERAAERLISLARNQVREVVERILIAEARAALAEMPAGQIEQDAQAVREGITAAARAKLSEIGVQVISLDVTRGS